MAELKQIEVNGTTYDIAVPGSDYPMITELLNTNGSGVESQSTLPDENGNYVFYKELTSPIIYLKAIGNTAGDHTISVGVLVDDIDRINFENDLQSHLDSV